MFKNNVRVCLMNKLVNVVEGPIKFDVQCPFVRGQKLSVRVGSPIDEHVRVRMLFKFVRCLIK